MGNGFPLHSTFEQLKVEGEALRKAFVDLRETLSRGSGGAGAGGGGAAGAGLSAVGRDATSAARGVNSLRDATRELSTATSGLQRSLKAGGDLAKLFGFEDASKQLEHFSKGVGALRELTSGIVAAARPLAGAAALVGVALGSLGAMQEAIRLTTGETLSLSATIAATALALDQQFTTTFGNVEKGLNNLRSIAAVAGRSLAQNLIGPLATGVKMLSDGLDAVGLPNGVRGLASTLESWTRSLEQNAAEVRTEVVAANRAIKDRTDATLEGIRAQINKVMNAGAGTSMKDNPLKALSELADDLIEKYPELQRVLDGISGAVRGVGTAMSSAQREQAALTASLARNMEGLSEDAVAAELAYRDFLRRRLDERRGGAGFDGVMGGTGDWRSSGQQGGVEWGSPDSGGRGTAMFRAGQQGGTEWAHGFETAVGPIFDKGVVDYLFVDPEDETKVVNSFNKLWKNIRRGFKDLLSDPLQLFASFFGVVGGELSKNVQLGNLYKAPGSGGGFLSFADGGAVGGRGQASLAHYLRPIGLALGGPPPGVPASDTVPAWLTPGEFVQPLSAVRTYGVQVMEALRRGAIAPELLRSLAGGISVPSPVRTPRARGYATGGAVAAGGGGGGTTVMPILPVSERLAEDILRSGGKSVHRWLRENGYEPTR
jgi:hypothetical protein